MDLIKFSFGGQKYTVPKHKAKNRVMQNFLKGTTILGSHSVLSTPKRRKLVRTLRKYEIGMPSKPRRVRRTVRRKRLTGVEIKNLRNLAPKFGLSSDSFDFHSEIDRTLSYRENKRILKKKLRRRTGTIPLEELRQDRYNFQLASYLNDLQFKADYGDVEAKRELLILTRRGYKK